MTDDPLRARIARLDPAAAQATDPITSATAHALLEEIMNTPLLETEQDQEPTPRHGRKPWAWPTLIAAAAVIALGLGAIAATGGFGGDTNDDDAAVASPAPTEAPAKLKVLELTAPGDNIAQMCIAISPELVAEMPVAFKGTVETSEAGLVTLTIDQAYTGTDAQVATLVAPEGMEALIGGVTFEPGQQYLITATDGVVNYCGFSGPATPELQAIFDQAFPTG
jgi:hypothetical protein